MILILILARYKHKCIAIAFIDLVVAQNTRFRLCAIYRRFMLLVHIVLALFLLLKSNDINNLNRLLKGQRQYLELPL